MNEHLPCSVAQPKSNSGSLGSAHRSEPASRTILKLLLATTFTLFSLTAIAQTQPARGLRRTASPAFPPAATQAKWELTSHTFEELGATVRPWDADQPNLMVAELSRGSQLTRDDAKRVVNSVKGQLGRWAVVYLADSNGKTVAISTLAKAH